METGTKVLIGLGVGIAVGVGIYFATRKSTDNIEGVGLPEYIDELVVLTKQNNGGSITDDVKNKLIANAKKVPATEFMKFMKVARKKESEWTPAEKETFVALAKKYNLRIGG